MPPWTCVPSEATLSNYLQTQKRMRHMGNITDSSQLFEYLSPELTKWFLLSNSNVIYHTLKYTMRIIVEYFDPNVCSVQSCTRYNHLESK